MDVFRGFLVGVEKDGEYLHEFHHIARHNVAAVTRFWCVCARESARARARVCVRACASQCLRISERVRACVRA